MINSCGLKNINAICYLNALIQSLLSSKSFINTIEKNKNNYNEVGKIFYNIIYKINNNIKIDDDNYILSKKLGFLGQNCSHEALTKIIEILKLENIFNIKYSKYKFCNNCHITTQQEIDDRIIYDFFQQNSKNNFSDSLNEEVEFVEDCKCEYCKKKVTHTILTRLIKSSDIFVIMFNQYDDKKIYHYDKIINLNNNIYKLIAKINHIGNKNYGHNWCIKYIDSKIFEINDENICELLNDSVDQFTYMIFYERINNP